MEFENDPLETPAETAETSEPQQEARRELYEFVKMVLVFLVVFWCLKTFVIEGYEVQGPSMLPTLHDRERILVFKAPHQLSKLSLFEGLFTPFKTGDIVVFDGIGNKRYVKRVIGLNPKKSENGVNAVRKDDLAALDDLVKVEYDKGRVRINDWQLNESGYLDPVELTSPDRDVCLLHPGEYYVLGDHRSVSKDSRSFRAIKDDQIVGRAVLRFWPLSKFGLL